MSTPINPVRPPSPKKLKELAALAQVGSAYASAAKNAIFSVAERKQFEIFARAYIGWLREDSPVKLDRSRDLIATKPGTSKR